MTTDKDAVSVAIEALEKLEFFLGKDPYFTPLAQEALTLLREYQAHHKGTIIPSPNISMIEEAIAVYTGSIGSAQERYDAFYERHSVSAHIVLCGAAGSALSSPVPQTVTDDARREARECFGRLIQRADHDANGVNIGGELQRFFMRHDYVKTIFSALSSPQQDETEALKEADNV